VVPACAQYATGELFEHWVVPRRFTLQTNVAEFWPQALR
jgi:hypothetical protein